MIDLLDIKESVHQVAQAIATVAKVDVEVINLNFCRVAGTGKYANDIGKKIKHNYVYQQVIADKLEIFIANPRKHSFCAPCPEKKCYHQAELCAPIFMNDAVIGVFGMMAFTEEQRKILVDYQEELMSFIKQMGQMIAAKANKELLLKQQIVAQEQLETIMNSVSEGIIAIDPSETITHCNDSGAKLLNLSKAQIIGKSLAEVLPQSPMQEVLKTGVGYLNREVPYNNSKRYFISTARPIMTQNQLIGVVNTFRPIEEVNQLIADYTDQNMDLPVNIIIGNSKIINDLRENISKFSTSTSTVLIRGESGTGKELIARSIHNMSPRKDKAFIALNCSAIPESLLESELFGYEEGAFTGAKKRGKPGKFEIADGGTIFLDEIGDMPIHLQAKILRTLQEKIVERVGGNTSIKVDIRILAATNRPLESMIQVGEFREDLYYRLNVIPLNIPPLRQRKEDIPPLLELFTNRYNTAFNKAIKGFSQKAMDLILEYHWPGNIRELENAVEYSFNIETSEYIREQSLPVRLRELKSGNNLNSLKTLKEIEKETIERALDNYGKTTEGKKQSAKALGIGIATLYRKLKEYELE